MGCLDDMTLEFGSRIGLVGDGDADCDRDRIRDSDRGKIGVGDSEGGVSGLGLLVRHGAGRKEPQP